MTNFRIRRSIVSDFEPIRNLLIKCFGERTENDVELFGYVTDGSIIVMTYDDKIVATAGIINTTFENEYVHELRYVCTDPEYRKQGIMHDVLKEAITSLWKSKKLICWAVREHEQTKANLHSILVNNGFKRVDNVEKEWTCKTCRRAYGFKCNLQYAVDSNGCNCHEELWIITKA